MIRMLILALLMPVTILAGSGPALSACPIEGCDPGDPPPITHTLHVLDSTQATVTATGINCGVAGDDCTESYTYAFADDAPSVMLTATGVPAGYTARLLSCTTVSGSTCSGSETQCGVGSCVLIMDANRRVRMTVADETPPSTATVSGPGKVGPAVKHFTASATDGAGVVSYRYYLDGVDQGLFSPGSGYDVPFGAISEGDHTLAARGRDAAGNESTTLSSVKSFTVDKSTGLTNVSTPPEYTQTTPDISFGVPGDAASVVCTTTGGAGGSTSGCTSPYTPQGVTTDGQYSVSIAVTDDVGNLASTTRTFTHDTGAPQLTVTKPENGDVLHGPFTPTASATDGYSDVTIDCKIDDGGFGTCDALAPSDGAHTLTVRASDAAGNTSEITRSFTYDAHPATASIELAKISKSWRLYGKRTQVRKLTLSGVPEDARVTVTCKGKGEDCAFKKLKITSQGKKIKLAPWFEKHKLRAQTVITITIKGTDGHKRFRYTVRANKMPQESIT